MHNRPWVWSPGSLGIDDPLDGWPVPPSLDHVNPGDHYAQGSRVTTINFLRYSPAAWYFIGGSGVAYHNRLRCVDYARLVEEAQFEITGSYSNTDALGQLRSGALRVHAEFEGYTPEQLACDIIGLFARPRPGGVATS